MGQHIEVTARVVGEVALFDADRSITGQDGAGYESLESAEAGTGLGAALAANLFAADDSIDHVFVASNGVSVQRDSGWDDSAIAAVTRLIGGFFVFYDGAVG